MIQTLLHRLDQSPTSQNDNSFMFATLLPASFTIRSAIGTIDRVRATDAASADVVIVSLTEGRPLVQSGVLHLDRFSDTQQIAAGPILILIPAQIHVRDLQATAHADARPD